MPSDRLRFVEMHDVLPGSTFAMAEQPYMRRRCGSQLCSRLSISF